MARFPYLPLWTDAYLGDTTHLTTIEHGAYLLLLMAAWRSPGCCLPDDDRRLAIMAGLTVKKWRAIRPIIAAFWIISDGVWKQKRLTKEITFVSRKSEKRRAAAEARWNAKPLKTQEPTHANASFLHMQNACNADAPTPTPIFTVKEREDSPLSPPRKRGRSTSTKHPLPDDFRLSEDDRDYARKAGIDGSSLEIEFEKFVNHARANGRRQADWRAAWRNWVRSPYQNQRRPSPTTVSAIDFKTQQRMRGQAAYDALRASIERDQAAARQNCCESDFRLLPIAKRE